MTNITHVLYVTGAKGQVVPHLFATGPPCMETRPQCTLDQGHPCMARRPRCMMAVGPLIMAARHRCMRAVGHPAAAGPGTQQMLTHPQGKNPFEPTIVE